MTIFGYGYASVVTSSWPDDLTVYLANEIEAKF
jgi:hypothetical protein